MRQLEGAALLLANANHVLDEMHMWAVRFNEDVDDLSASSTHLTLEEIGRISWLIAGAEMDIHFMQKHLEDVRHARDTAALFARATEVVTRD